MFEPDVPCHNRRSFDGLCPFTRSISTLRFMYWRYNPGCCIRSIWNEIHSRHAATVWWNTGLPDHMHIVNTNILMVIFPSLASGPQRSPRKPIRPVDKICLYGGLMREGPNIIGDCAPECWGTFERGRPRCRTVCGLALGNVLNVKRLYRVGQKNRTVFWKFVTPVYVEIE